MKHKELLEKIQNALRETPSEPQTHSYAQTTALRVPNHVPMQAPAKPVTRKTDVVTKEWNKEVQQTSNCSSHIDVEPSPVASLIPNRVHRWNIKNYASIARHMQMHVKPKKGEMTEKVSVISTSEEQQATKEEKKQDELWRDMMKNNEERHFRIGRITNYFS